jgi:aminoglycoside phosphotransferase (APT) family kinase protein
VPVGKILHYDDMVTFFQNPKYQPKDRSTFVHGDYKIDNVVFHKTEPRVIGILEYVIHITLSANLLGINNMI